MAHEILMLGTGNAFLPHGRHHSFCCIDRKHIIDAPPTALAGLRRAGIKISDIETIFVTHVHGDHVFGFPFLLLERRYISDREMLKPLTIVGSKLVKERLWQLCQLAFPGSLEEIFQTISWIEETTGTVNEWSFERFKVNHDISVDPHGYRLQHSSGANLVHSGDTGPCEELYQAIERSNIAIVEMGVPEWVEIDGHHKPSHIESLSQRVPDTKLLLTHTYLDMKDSEFEVLTSKDYPVFNDNVIHAHDGICLKWNGQNWKA
jgi:ribonuclease BN (tRNA processing enzyme)